MKLHLPLAAALLAASAGLALAQQRAPVAAPAAAQSEDAALTQFLDAAFDEQNATNPQVLTQLGSRQLYDRLNSMASRVDEVMAGLESGEGTAGQLLQDRQLYENMNRTVTELRDLLADIRRDPKQYLRVNVSIF